MTNTPNSPKKQLPLSLIPPNDLDKQYAGMSAAEKAEIQKLLGQVDADDYDYEDDLPVKGYKPANASSYVRCHKSHKPLLLCDGLVIHGGSCSQPIEGMDIYVGFDHSMAKHRRAWPWVPGEAFLFPITDMSAPSDPKEFANLINYLDMQLRKGKQIHCGCIGGHGRTGTVFAALVAQMMGQKDAIQYVRKNYCEKAVESKTQVDFLMKHYGVNAAPGTKSSYGGISTKNAPKAYTGPQSFKALQANFCLWGPTATIS